MDTYCYADYGKPRGCGFPRIVMAVTTRSASTERGKAQCAYRESPRRRGRRQSLGLNRTDCGGPILRNIAAPEKWQTMRWRRWRYGSQRWPHRESDPYQRTDQKGIAGFALCSHDFGHMAKASFAASSLSAAMHGIEMSA